VLEELNLNHPIDFMRLTLTYSGPLHAQTNKDGRIAEKHEIRRKFHKQMREVFETHPALKDMYHGEVATLGQADLANEASRRVKAQDVGNFRFASLINRANWLACELDILFLRHEPAGYIVDSESGDIDNRIKVLFDALRIPLNTSELPSTARPEDGERPFFCLLENDSLITAFRLESERLLFPQSRSEAEVQLVIRVNVKAIKVTWANIGLAD
jgi:hypothetical protein